MNMPTQTGNHAVSPYGFSAAGPSRPISARGSVVLRGAFHRVGRTTARGASSAICARARHLRDREREAGRGQGPLLRRLLQLAADPGVSAPSSRSRPAARHRRRADALTPGADVPRPYPGEGAGPRPKRTPLAPGHALLLRRWDAGPSAIGFRSTPVSEANTLARRAGLASLAEAGAARWAGPMVPASTATTRRSWICRTSTPASRRVRFAIPAPALEPGDAIAFNYRSVHGAAGQYRRQSAARVLLPLPRRRRDLHRTPPGRTSAALSRHRPAEAAKRMREDWFPTVWRG